MIPLIIGCSCGGSELEVKEALKRIKAGKACGVEIPWICDNIMANYAIQNNFWSNEMPEEWRKSILDSRY
jgi:hypothetical protein